MFALLDLEVTDAGQNGFISASFFKRPNWVVVELLSAQMVHISIDFTLLLLLTLVFSLRDALALAKPRMTTRRLTLEMGLESTVVLKGNGLSKNWIGNDRPQFKDISLSIVKGNRIGLIGPNGTGKSTLLKVLASLEESDAGQLEVEKNSVIVYVEQEPYWSKDPKVKLYKVSISHSILMSDN